MDGKVFQIAVRDILIGLEVGGRQSPLWYDDDADGRRSYDLLARKIVRSETAWTLSIIALPIHFSSL